MCRRLSVAWLDTVADAVLVVGNGVLNVPVPEEQYASVIRLNNYILGGLSGSKVTHWVTSGYKNIETRPLPIALVPWSVHWQRRVRHDLSFCSRIGGEVVFAESNGHLLNWFPDFYTNWIRFPSVGFCLLAWLHSKKRKVDVIGFDGMVTGHQSNPSHVHGHRRTKAKEWNILNSYFIHKNLGGGTHERQ